MELSKEVLEELVALMQRDGLDRLRVEIGDFDLDLRMSMGNQVAVVPAAVAAPSAVAPKTALEAPANVRKILAPLVGVFYRRPAPDANAFVEVGDEVVAGQVLCILEAMKLMNEIVSEYSGKVARTCAKDGELVTLQQELFWIET